MIPSPNGRTDDLSLGAVARLRARMSEQVVVSIVYVAALFVSILDMTIVNVALPTLSTELDTPTGSVEWVVTGYLLSLAVWIPASGWIGDRFGVKRIMLLALAIFTGASLLCGMATSLEQLVAFRILQGVGGGMLAPVGMAMLFRAFPPEKRAAASKVLIIPTAVAPASGPIVGGLLIDELSWRWVFLVNVPIGVATVVFGALFLRERKDAAAGRFDVAGFALSGAGLASILYALSQGPREGWLAPQVATALVAGLIAFAALVVVELRIDAPMLQLRLFRDRLFRASNTASVFSTGCFLGMLFIMPTFLQQVHSVSAFESGLTTFPEALGVLTVSQLAGRLYPRIGPRRLMIAGLGGMAAVLGGIAVTDLGTSLWTYRALMYLLGGCFSFIIISLQTATFARISPDDMGRASAIFNFQIQMSAALGVAVLATSLAAFLPDGGGASIAHGAELTAYRGVFLVAAGLAIVAALFAGRIHDADAAETMVLRAEAREPVSPAL